MCFQGFERVVELNIHGGPVIAPGPLERAVVKAETEPADQMEPGARGRTEPGDIACVRRYFRFPQRNLKHLVLPKSF